MKLWRLSDPRGHEFAEAGLRGTWSNANDGPCPECTASRQMREKPLVLAWQPGANEVGDFTWPGLGSDIVVAGRVLGLLQDHLSGFEAGPVEMTEDPNVSKRAKRVLLPYKGPELHELWVTRWVHLDPVRSSVELENRCGTCGAERWEVYGVERWDSHFDPERKQLVRVKTERLPSAGILVSETDLAGDAIFRVHELPGWVFCTELVRELVEKEQFSNVSFLEMGDTF